LTGTGDTVALDTQQDTWPAPSGARLAIDGDRFTLTGQDGWNVFNGRLTAATGRLSFDGTVRAWRLDGGRLWLDETEWRRRLRDAPCERR